MGTDIYEGHGIIITRFYGGAKRGMCYQVNFESVDNGIVYIVYTENEFWNLINDLIKLKDEEDLARTIEEENRATKLLIKETMKKTESIVVDQLIDAQINLSYEDFKKLFKNAEARPKHYWKLFSETYNHNLLMFLKYLGEEKDLVIDYILSR